MKTANGKTEIKTRPNLLDIEIQINLHKFEKLFY